MSTSELLRKLMLKVDPDMKRMVDGLDNPKILAGPDGNVTLSAIEMQYIYDLLRFTVSEAYDVASLSRKILRAHTTNTPPSVMDFLTLSRRAPSIVRDLRFTLKKLEDALPFANNPIIGKNKIDISDKPCNSFIARANDTDEVCLARPLTPVDWAASCTVAPEPAVEEDLYA